MTFLLVVLSAFYITYVITKSEFPPAESLRVQIVDRYGEGSSAAYLVQCAWCAGFYVSGVVALATDVAVGIDMLALVWLGTAAAVGILSELVSLITDLRMKV
jgi:hypothetical protein